MAAVAFQRQYGIDPPANAPDHWARHLARSSAVRVLAGQRNLSAKGSSAVFWRVAMFFISLISACTSGEHNINAATASANAGFCFAARWFNHDVDVAAQAGKAIEHFGLADAPELAA